MRVLGRVVLAVLFAAAVTDASEAANATSEAVDEGADAQGWIWTDYSLPCTG